MIWLDYGLIYCFIGVIVLFGLPPMNRFLKKETDDELTSEDWRSFLDSLLATTWERFRDSFLFPLFAICLVILGWPYLIYLFIKDHWFPDPPYVEKAFAVEREHLGKALAVEEIEAIEQVHDPLGAVPDLPFGHLNAAWGEFKADVADGDSVWSFAATWQGDWGGPELRDGYVLVKADGSFGPYFMTKWILLDKPEPPKPKARNESQDRRDIPEFLRRATD